jgi:hypothetical protein
MSIIGLLLFIAWRARKRRERLGSDAGSGLV